MGKFLELPLEFPGSSPPHRLWWKSWTLWRRSLESHKRKNLQKTHGSVCISQRPMEFFPLELKKKKKIKRTAKLGNYFWKFLEFWKFWQKQKNKFKGKRHQRNFWSPIKDPSDNPGVPPLPAENFQPLCHQINEAQSKMLIHCSWALQFNKHLSHYLIYQHSNHTECWFNCLQNAEKSTWISSNWNYSISDLWGMPISSRYSFQSVTFSVVPL